MNQTPEPVAPLHSRTNPRLPGLAPVALLVAVGLVTSAFFAMDLSLPHGVIDGMPYVLLATIGWWIDLRGYCLFYGVAATALTIAGFVLTPPEGSQLAGLANRSISLVILWLVIVVLTGAGRARRSISQEKSILEDRVTACTSELRTVRRTLTRAARLASLGERAGTVAHELRNPLGVILTSITIFETMAASAGLNIDAALGRARRAIQRCEDIITENLDTIRAHGHRPAPYILDHWLQSLLEELGQTVGPGIRPRFEAGEILVLIDPESFRRAIINLLDNARQALTDDPAAGEITLGSRLDGAGVEVFVADNGPGIPAALLSRVADPLFSTKRSGTGLGLPMVQSIMDDHEGETTIESMPGKGTRVGLRLPRADHA